MKLVTLGPQGTCHENAVRHYLNYHRLENFEIILITDFLEGLELVYAGQADYLVQCSAHPHVHLITEKYFQKVKVMDTFIFPTKELVLLENTEVEHPQTLGLVKATEGYLDGITYPEIIYEPSKPVVGAGLLEGKYDAGLTHIEYYQNHPNRFRVRKHMGEVVTTWIVYGHETVFNGTVLSVMPSGFYK
ncbi:hypothetical protein EEL31_06870 [Brevibacillus laterosporus]|nr:hypothetical protein [Brevibacillus laterosporus]TPG68276.1 hypothetical protein EEL31_06870 [Brevibacillus laterosporus]